ncbi:MAG: peptidase U32 family protein [Nibricoccus sp.]
MKRAPIPELLAPAGDWKSLDAALDAGADAVYFGVRGLNMRAAAKNFTSRDLPKIVARCQERNARAYLTLNVVVFEAEVGKLQRLLNAAKKAGVDAVIGADFAVLSAAHELGLEVHASTQMSVANSSAFGFLLKLGIKRVVLARECSLADIKRIKAALGKAVGKKAEGVKIEAFAHGAMCVSMSGRCFLSNFEAGRSANRGECAQHCRREYKIVEQRAGEEWVLGKDYILSPKDLCTLPFIERLIEVGVDSLKIEGRNRGPEYVSTVVSAYRQALDFYAENRGGRDWRNKFSALKVELVKKVQNVFNRGFSDGFYFGKPLGKWNAEPQNASPLQRRFVGTVVNFYRKPSVVEIAVQGDPFATGDELQFEGNTTGFFKQIVESLQVDGRSVTQALAGTSVGMRVSEPVRRGDKIYVMRARKPAGATG